MIPKLAILQFPGTNCEYETQRCAIHFGFDAKIIRWNDTTDAIKDADAVIVPGGFSFQDRVRAGAIAAKLPIIMHLIEADRAEKPILGICNGAQILAEAGLFPNFKQTYNVQAALAPNIKNGQHIGHICEWVYVKIENPQHSIFTKEFTDQDILPVVISHGEGRFVLESDDHLDRLTQVKYCTQSGKIDTSFPTNPNGTRDNIAGLSNEKGNVLALMPHPERAVFLRQIPDQLPSHWQAFQNKHNQEDFIGTDCDGPWAKLFQSMYNAVKVKINA